ncbi:helix-turn-helix domain-containing protein [Agromyces sp. S2-1-8]|uniref:helix-turn-helix domain-containing protein n=1 Tax=unclassified Agromyces TaxID=2639701 RepID=UPI001E54ED5D|nr:helix-turn-helix domain-containing protein [Agromyces sp. S2-1-8]MCD5347406.1 helix-turn-helix domain-containing protein [Agromyces sp. S2-1-8]
MPRRVGDFRGLTQPSRIRLLRAIQREPGRRASELAEESGIPTNTVRDHLQVLEREGLIRGVAVPTQSRGRPPIGFHPVQDAATSAVAGERIAGARRRGALLRATTGVIDGDLDEDARMQLDVLYEHLDDAGLEPAVDEAELSFELAPCRYHDLIDDDMALVCSVHARLVGDVLRQTGGPLALKGLQPFVTDHRCKVALARREAD